MQIALVRAVQSPATLCARCTIAWSSGAPCGGVYFIKNINKIKAAIWRLLAQRVRERAVGTL